MLHWTGQPFGHRLYGARFQPFIGPPSVYPLSLHSAQR